MAKKDKFVVDSSVVAKWDLMEPGSDEAIVLAGYLTRFATISRWKMLVAIAMLCYGYDSLQLLVAALG